MEWWGNSALLVSDYDSNAQAYITAVEAADGQALEAAVRDAINAFVVGCKADGIWAAIKACCILAGARTLAGALVPLVGPAPTNFGFTASDYNRKTGLVTDGTKHLSTNRSTADDPDTDCSLSVFQTAGGDSMMTGYLSANNIPRQLQTTATFADLRLAGGQIGITDLTGPGKPGLIGVSRTSNTITGRVSQTSSTVSVSVTASTSTGSVYVFARHIGSTGAPQFTTAGVRLAIYHVGRNLNLSVLEARIATLMTTLAGLTL